MKQFAKFFQKLAKVKRILVVCILVEYTYSTRSFGAKISSVLHIIY